MKYMIFAVMILFTLAACSKESMDQQVNSDQIENTPAVETKASYVIEYVSFAEGISDYSMDKGTFSKRMKDENYIRKVYGEMFEVYTIKELKALLTKQLHDFDKRFLIKIPEVEAPIEQIDTILYDIIHENSMIAGTLLLTDFTYENIKDATYLSFENLFTVNAIEMAAIQPKIEEILQSLQLEEKNDIDKLERIHQYILDHMIYKEGETVLKDHSPYGFFINGEGVCQAYAMALHMMLEAVGIESLYVVGDIAGTEDDDVLHAWNLVKIDDIWRHVDPTFNDDGEPTRFFMKTDFEMGFTHVWDQTKYPAASSI